MKIQWRIAPEQLFDNTESDRISRALHLMNVETGIGIDSYSMGADGPYLSSAFIVTKEFLIEIHLSSADLEFDLARADLLSNYRVKLGEQALNDSTSTQVLDDEAADKPEEGERQTNSSEKIQFAQIQLAHGGGLVSMLSYFGEDQVNWLEFVLQTYPVSNLLGKGAPNAK